MLARLDMAIKIKEEKIILQKKTHKLGGSPGLMVMGGDSCYEGCGFESHHQIQDGHFTRIFVVKIVTFV